MPVGTPQIHKMNALPIILDSPFFGTRARLGACGKSSFSAVGTPRSQWVWVIAGGGALYVRNGLWGYSIPVSFVSLIARALVNTFLTAISMSEGLLR